MPQQHDPDYLYELTRELRQGYEESPKAVAWYMTFCESWDERLEREAREQEERIQHGARLLAEIKTYWEAHENGTKTSELDGKNTGHHM